MNDIKLNQPLFSNKNYIIYLDAENKFLFKNKREAKDFLTKINKKVDEAILLVTEEFNTLEELFRLFYLADKDYKFKYEVNNSVGFITNRLAWMTEHSGSINHDAILFQSILGCFSELVNAYGLIRKKANERKDTITKRRCALRIDIVTLFKRELLSTGIKPAVNYLEIKKSIK